MNWCKGPTTEVKLTRAFLFVEALFTLVLVALAMGAAMLGSRVVAHACAYAETSVAARGPAKTELAPFAPPSVNCK